MVEEHQLVVTFTAAGSADDYQEGSAASLQVKTALATTANVDANKVTLVITSGSVNIDAIIAVEDATAAAAAESAVGGAMSDASAASALLGIVVESAPVLVTKVAVVDMSPPSPPPSPLPPPPPSLPPMPPVPPPSPPPSPPPPSPPPPTPPSPPPSSPASHCDQIALASPNGIMVVDECGMQGCAPDGDGVGDMGVEHDNPTACTDCSQFIAEGYGCFNNAHCTVNDRDIPTECRSCTSIQNVQSLSDCTHWMCGWDGTSSTCAACPTFEAADEAACQAYGCTKGPNTFGENSQIATPWTTEAPADRCISTSFGDSAYLEDGTGSYNGP